MKVEDSPGPNSSGRPKEKPPSPMRAPRGSVVSCKGWRQEAVLRLLLNSLDPEVADGSASIEGMHSVLSILQAIAGDQSMVVELGKPPIVLQSDESSPRVVLLSDATSTTGERDRWTLAGLQGHVCAAFLTLAAAADRRFGADLAGKFLVSGGMGRLGGVVSLAATMNGSAFLGIDPDESAILARVRAGYCDICVNDLDEALRILKVAIRQKQPVSVGLAGNCATILPEMARRGILPDLLTDRTGGQATYIPAGMAPHEAAQLRATAFTAFQDRVKESQARHLEALLALQRLGAILFEFGNGIFSATRQLGLTQASSVPDFASEYLYPSIRGGDLPIRWFALSGERSDILKLDDALIELAPTDSTLVRWLRLSRKHVRFQGLPARAASMHMADLEKWASRLNELVARGEIKAPIVVCREFSASDPIPNLVSSEVNLVSARQLIDRVRNLAPGSAFAQLEFGHSQTWFRSIAVVADGTPEASQALYSLCRIPTIH